MLFQTTQTLLPPHSIPLGRPSAPAPSIQYRASNLDWRLVSSEAHPPAIPVGVLMSWGPRMTWLPMYLCESHSAVSDSL